MSFVNQDNSFLWLVHPGLTLDLLNTCSVSRQIYKNLLLCTRTEGKGDIDFGVDLVGCEPNMPGYNN